MTLLRFLRSGLLIAFRGFVAPDADVVEEPCQRSQRNAGERDGFTDSLPHTHHRADVRVSRKTAVQPRLVSVMEHIHDMRAANTGRIVESGLIEAARLQVFHTLRRVVLISSLVPNTRAPVGQALMQAGSRPTATRSEHKVHLYALWSFFEIRGMSKGQPAMQ